ncbi:MAG TPA: helicase RepA family protein [Steroidobacteraceae bacterium]|nr:helicase RepA family protein [Steroidobacteraceae bacterium]
MKAHDATNPAAPLPVLALLWFATLREVSRQDHIVKDLLLAGTLFVIYGESNSGKTFFLLDLALTAARGASWRGRRTRRGLVLYIAGEGATSVRNRVAAYRVANPEVHGGLPFAIVPFAVDFLDPEAVTVLIETIRAAESECGEKVVLVCIDTFARAVAGGDENSAQDVGLAVAGADRIRNETGACVGFVHHAGKDATKGARGSSALRAAVDTEIMVEGQSGQRTAVVCKQRDLESGQRMPFELVPVEIDFDPEDNTLITSCVVRHLDDEAAPAPAMVQLRGKAQRQLLSALRARTETTPDHIYTLPDLRQIGKELGLSKSTARYAVDAIVASPYMQPTIGGYRFTDGVPK